LNRRRAAVAIVAAAAAVVVWMLWPEGDEGAIRRRLYALVADANEGAGDGLATLARAARLGTYFTEDVVVDLGQGTEPIEGRDTLVGIAARLEPRTASAPVNIEDATVTMRDDDAIADVTLTVTYSRRDGNARDPTLDAREFTLEVRKDDGEWRIARVTAVDTLR
jgi:SnoaL-like domain